MEKESTDLMSIDGMDPGMASILAAKGIKTGEVLAELSADELVDITGMPEERAQNLIMAARAPWFS